MQQTPGYVEFFRDITFINLTNALITLIIAYALSKLLSFLFLKFSERLGYYRIAAKMIVPLVKFFVYGLAVYYILIISFSIDIANFVALAGLLGAAIGFGLKDVFASMIGGVIVTLEQPYRIGDMIRIGSNYGEVMDIGLRSTKIATPTGHFVSIPNYTVFRDPVSSANGGTIEMLVVVDLYVDPSSDIHKAMKIFKEAVISSRYVYIAPDRQFVIFYNDFPFYRRLRAKAFVYDLRKEFDYRSEVTERTWQEFNKCGIKAPSANILDTGTYDVTGMREQQVQQSQEGGIQTSTSSGSSGWFSRD